MKINFLLAFLCTCTISLFAQDITYNKTVDEIWGGRVFMELNGKYAGVSRIDEGIAWPTNDRTVMVYCLRVPRSHVRADVVLTPRAGRTVTFNLRVVQANTGEVITENTCSLTCKKAEEQTLELLPDFTFPSDTWYRFEITSPKGNTCMSQFTKLRFQRKSSQGVGDSPIFMAPSVHLHSYSSTDKSAPSGEAYDWIYQEGMIPPEYELPSTYAMVIGIDGGYSGFQSIYNSNGTWTRPILFSIWDNGDLDKDPAMPEYLKSGVLDTGEDVVGVRFGGEGTGSSARLLNGSWWTPGKWVQFLWNARPEQVKVSLKDHEDNDSVVSYENTLVSCWYKMEDASEWHYLGTLRESGRNHYFKGLYSFLENFYDVGGEFVHRAYFRNAAMRSLASGKWYARNNVDFGHTQNDGTRFSRKDYGHGVTKLYDNCFFLQTGGFGNIEDSAKVLPLPEEMPWVDTINIKALAARVDEAIRKDEAVQAASRLKSFRTVDMSKWTLLKYSDEETEGEGDNGRAAQVIDGNSSTYWHSKWKNSKAPFPHYFIFDAGVETTITGISLYQSRESGYRARMYRLYTSEDGKTWKSRKSGAFSNDNSPEVDFGTELTSRYFKLDFLSSYGGDVLAINEISFMCPYRLDRMLNATNEIIRNAGRLGGYRKPDVQHLIPVYDEGNCTDTLALKEALEKLSDATPLKYSVVNKLQHISTTRCYQIHNISKQSVLCAQKDNMETSLVKDGTEDAMDSCANWLVLHSEPYRQYYIYNVGTGLYLGIEGTKLVQSEQPKAISISAVSGAYRFNTLSDSYQLLDNFSMAPDMDYAFKLLLESEIALHPEMQTSIAPLQLQNLQTYYDLHGRRVLDPHGIVIVRSNDGNVKKMLFK